MRQKIFGFLIATLALVSCSTVGTENKPVQPVAVPTGLTRLWEGSTSLDRMIQIAAWSRDGSTVVAKNFYYVFAFDALTQKFLRRIPVSNNVSMALSVSPRRMVQTDDTKISVTNLDTNQVLAKINNPQTINKVAISDNGNTVIFESANNLYRFDLSSGTPTPNQIAAGVIPVSGTFVPSTIDVTLNQAATKTLISGMRVSQDPFVRESTLILRNSDPTGNSKILCNQDLSGGLTIGTWSRDGSKVFYTCQRQLFSYNIATDTSVLLLSNYRIDARSIVSYDSDKHIAITRSDYPFLYQEIYNLETELLEPNQICAGANWGISTEVSLIPSANDIDCAFLFGNNTNQSIVLRGLNKQDRELVSPSELVFEEHKTNIYDLAWSPTGQWFASAGRDGTVKILDGTTGQASYSLTADAGKVYTVAWKPGGKTLAAAGEDGVIKLWDIPDDGSSVPIKLGSLFGHTYTVRSLAWHPDGTKIVSASWDGSVRVWNIANQSEITTLTSHQGFVNDVVYSPTGNKFATASSDKTIKIWDSATNTELLTIVGATEPVLTLAWSPDGTKLATAGVDKNIRIYDPSTGTLLTSWRAHYDAIRGLQWMNDGTAIASISQDNSLRVWSPTSQQLFAPIEQNPLFSIALDPTGKKLVTGDDDAYITAYEVK